MESLIVKIATSKPLGISKEVAKLQIARAIELQKKGIIKF
jgi:hypothetical protein